MKKYQLPKEFAEKWVKALRSKLNCNKTPDVIQSSLKDKVGSSYLLSQPELRKEVLNQYLQRGGSCIGNIVSASWLEQNVEFI